MLMVQYEPGLLFLQCMTEIRTYIFQITSGRPYNLEPALNTYMYLSDYTDIETHMHIHTLCSHTYIDRHILTYMCECVRESVV